MSRLRSFHVPAIDDIRHKVGIVTIAKASIEWNLSSEYQTDCAERRIRE